MKLFWLSTEIHPDRVNDLYHGPSGWKLHAVYADPTETFAAISRRRSVCGLKPKRGWDRDPFLSDFCARCEKALEKLEGVIEDPSYRIEVLRIEILRKFKRDH